jgi:replicative superfamily II helicase
MFDRLVPVAHQGCCYCTGTSHFRDWAPLSFWAVDDGLWAMADDVRELDLPQGVADLLIETWGIERLHPPQAEALPVALSGRNMLLAIPTASGKSLVAYLAILQKLLVDAPGSRAFYLVPLKALAAEKVEELREAGDALGLIVGMAVGDRSGETVS